MEIAVAEEAAAEEPFAQPLSTVNGQPDPVSVEKTGLFAAKFEGSDVEGTAEAVDGVYRFSATKTDGEAWHVKLESNYPTVAGRDYRVTYRFRSDVAGKVKFGDFQEFEIEEGENTVTGVINNSNLQAWASAADLRDGYPIVRAASEMSGIPVVHTTGRKEFLEEFLQDDGLDPNYIGIPIALETYMHRSWEAFTREGF